LVTGIVPLTPIQHWYFEGRQVNPEHFNQAVLLEAAQPLNAEALRTAVQSVVEHHDALRLRFEQGETSWQQFNESAIDVPISEVDLSHVPDAEQLGAIAAAATKIQASMNLSAGRLLRVAVFRLGAGRRERLLLAAHHLVVDGVSWRVLLEDLQTAYLQLDRGLSVQLPLKTTSFKRWSELLTERAQLPELLEELSFWLAQTVAEDQRLPVDNPAGANTRDSERQVSVSLTADETRELLQTLPKIYQTEINDVLLTALAQSLAQWIGSRCVLVNLEGHGREDVSDEVDSSRTVGWFTAIYPVLLDIGHSADLGVTLRSIKEQLRLVPHHGIGYGLLRYLKTEVVEQLRAQPQPEVSFNYLGQFDQMLRGSSLFKPAGESSGVAASPMGMRRHLLEINGIVAGGRFQITFAYSENVHRRSTIEILADDFVVALRELINHRESAPSTRYSASDFADFNWGQSELDSIAAAIGKKSH
jgi:non-ribosomal peptide synthase protein (TIGR01720 family)